ncbi:thiamine diphosphate-binding protein [Mrakia frigida]|uniref:putative indolepyruvate decarboxylase family protein n=1 Tax=Mrakia frigida TaxID=29902 RepID=UPI003FCC25C8
MPQLSGSQVIAQSLKNQGVTHIFGIVGIPVRFVAQACIDLGIRFISFRNEQSASYAASAYGYLTGRPGVLLVVGGPGVVHALAGVAHAAANSFPLLMLAGASETFQQNQGAFQELDQVGLLKGETKFAARPPSLGKTPATIEQAYRVALYGRPGPTYVDLPADYIQGSISSSECDWKPQVSDFPRGAARYEDVSRMVDLLESAERPLIVIGKGAQFSRAETAIHALLTLLPIPFLPTPMGKGHIPDSHPLCIAAARSTALKGADVVLVLGARLNWILHYGSAPKWSGRGKVKWLRVDVKAEELDDNERADVGVVGDVKTVVEQLVQEVVRRRRAAQSGPYKPPAHQLQWHKTLFSSVKVNTKKNLSKTSSPAFPMTYHQAFSLILPLLPKSHIFVSEGANTLDIGRSFFPVEEPRSRLDSGSTATMGVGLGFAIAAAVVEKSEGGKGRKVVAVVGDSAFGFSAMEVETAVRNKLGILVVVMNNSGVYHGLSASNYNATPLASLPPTALLPDVRYDQIATACGGIGHLVRTPEELQNAIRAGMVEDEKVTVVNVLMDPGKGGKLEFAWLASAKKESKL